MKALITVLSAFLLFSCSANKNVVTQQQAEKQEVTMNKVDSELIGKWKLEYMSPVDGKNVNQLFRIQMPYLTFVDEEKVAGNNGCNNIAGLYTRDGKMIQFHTDKFASTRMYCQDLDEAAFVGVLKTINNYSVIDNGNKLMLLTSDIASMIFVKVEE